MKRNLELDVVRCGMNYMIVLLHAWAAFQYVDRTTIEFKSWTFVLDHLCWMAVPTFFLISGYLLYTNFSLASYPDKMRRRVKRLAVPYVVWNVTFVVFYLAMARLVPRLATRVATFGLDTWGGALSKVLSLTVAPIDGPLWFLRVLLILTTVSPLLFLLMRMWRGVPALVLCTAWIVAESYFGLTSFLHLTSPAYAILCFVLGGVLALNGKDIVQLFRPWHWVVLGILACVVRWYIDATSDDASLTVWLIDNLLAPLEAPALLTLVSRLPIENVSFNPVYRYFKYMSFFAYAGHFLFCSIFLHTLAPLLSGMTTGKMTVLVLIFFCLGVPAMALVYWFGRRFAPKVLRFYDGTL